MVNSQDSGLPITEHFEGQVEILEVRKEHLEEDRSPLNGWVSEDSLEMIDEDPWHENSHDSKVTPLDHNQL